MSAYSMKSSVKGVSGAALPNGLRPGSMSIDRQSSLKGEQHCPLGPFVKRIPKSDVWSSSVRLSVTLSSAFLHIPKSQMSGI